MQDFEHWTTVMSVLAFFVLVFVEALVATRKGKDLFEGGDTMVNIALGLLTFLTKIGSKGAILYLYTQIFSISPWQLPEDSWVWFVAGLLLNDLLFYWYHRLSHTTRFFWALHVAHHSSYKMNITTAMRGNFLNNLFHAFFWIPMLLLGFPPIVVVLTDAASYFYQLWLHTTVIPKLGPVEWIFNTPSHHRVHHGSNPQYIDKNYGAIFIFWDRMFGTFEAEEEEVRYGLTKPFKSNNPIDVAFNEFVQLSQDLGSKAGFPEKVRELIRKP